MSTLLSLLLAPVLSTALAVQSVDGELPPPQTWPAQTLDESTGLRIWEYPSADPASFHMLVMVGVGSRDEERKHAGISHLLEHSLFLSTEERSESELIKGIRRQSGQYNGQTTVDWTAYWVSLPAENWEYGVDWLTELIAKPSFLDDEVMRERGIVIEELNTRHEHGRAPLLEGILYGDHPLARSIGGDEDSVLSIDTDDVVDWYRKNYTLDNLVVAFSGGVPHQPCTDRIQARLSGMSTEVVVRKEHTLEPNFGPSMIGTGQHMPDDSSGLLVLGHAIKPTGATDLATLLIANRLLSDTIFDEVRSKRGLAYSPISEFVICDDVWRLDCRIEVGERDNLLLVLTGAEIAFDSLNTVSEEDFLFAKNTVQSSLFVGGPMGLLESVERTWTLRNTGRQLELGNAIGKLERRHFTAGTKRLLIPERQFLLSDSKDVIRPGSSLAAFLLTGLVIAGLSLLYLPKRLVRGWAGRQIQAVQNKRRSRKTPTPILAFPAKADVDQLEREFGEFFEEIDQKGK